MPPPGASNKNVLIKFRTIFSASLRSPTKVASSSRHPSPPPMTKSGYGPGVDQHAKHKLATKDRRFPRKRVGGATLARQDDKGRQALSLRTGWDETGFEQCQSWPDFSIPILTPAAITPEPVSVMWRTKTSPSSLPSRDHSRAS